MSRWTGTATNDLRELRLASQPRPMVIQLAALVSLVAFASTATAQQQGDGARTTPEHPLARQLQALPGHDKPHGPAERKIHTQLLVNIAAKTSGKPIAGPDPVELDIVARVSDALLEKIRQLGGTVVNAFPADHVIRARLPLAQIAGFAADPAVVSVAPAIRPTLHADVAATEGDTAHEAKLARQQHFTDPATAGDGVKVCVISDSNDDGNGALQHAKDVGAIDADAAKTSVLKDSNRVFQDGMAIPGYTPTGEGLAMMEIIHQLAPGASIEFATSLPSQAQMKENILGLAADGCQVIVDDVSFADELPFQEDIVAQAVREAGARGISYFSSVSNFGNVLSRNASAWAGQFLDSGASLNNPNYPGHFHSFGTLDYVTVTALPSTDVSRVTLRLVDPTTQLESSTGNDYEFYLTDSMGGVIAYSKDQPTAARKVIDLTNVSSHPKLLVGDRLNLLKRPSNPPRDWTLGATRGTTFSAFTTVNVDHLTVLEESGRNEDQVSLFWNDPVKSPPPGSPPSNVPNEYDLYLTDSADNPILYAAGQSSAPRQVISLNLAPSHPKLLAGDRIYVLKRDSAAGRFLHVDTSGAPISPFTSGRTRGHNASPAPNVYSIAALPVAKPAVALTANGGVARASADGPRVMFFKPDGSDILPGGAGAEVPKPDFTAAEGSTTTLSAARLHTFYGSSAAAPHAAAIAALVLSKYPSMSPARLRYVLNHSVLANGGSEPGHALAWNRYTGGGTLMASLALDEAKRIAETERLATTFWFYGFLKPDGTFEDRRASPYGGTKPPAQPPALTDVTKLSLGAQHAVALRKNGKVEVWGGPAANSAVTALPSGLDDIIDVAAGWGASVAVKRDGTVRGWGQDLRPPFEAYTVPAGLTGIRSVFMNFADQLQATIAIKRDGSVVAWEPNGSLLAAPAIKDLVGVVPARYGALALEADGTVVSWNWPGIPGPPSPRHAPPPGLTDVLALAAGERHALALKRDGTVVAWAWGKPEPENEWGQATVPDKLSGVVAISAHLNRSFALKADGSIVQWGQPDN
jgi:hypothetical protein